MLKNRVAFITGGSRGIGKTTASHFLQDGAKVAIMASSGVEVSSAAEELEVLGCVGDVANPEDVRRCITAALKDFGRIDILVNAAGIQPPIGSFIDNDFREWKRNVEVNLFGTMQCIKEVLPIMVDQKSGTIVNFSGGGATSARPNFSAYAVAKTGVVRFTEVLGAELAGTGVRVNAIAPGAVNTYMLEEVLKTPGAGEKELQDARKRKQTGGTPVAVAAELVAFLASAASAPLSGRLVSVVWDDWKSWKQEDILEIMGGERLTLRRTK